MSVIWLFVLTSSMSLSTSREMWIFYLFLTFWINDRLSRFFEDWIFFVNANMMVKRGKVVISTCKCKHFKSKLSSYLLRIELKPVAIFSPRRATIRHGALKTRAICWGHKTGDDPPVFSFIWKYDLKRFICLTFSDGTVSISVIFWSCSLSNMLNLPATRWQPNLSSCSSILVVFGIWQPGGAFKDISIQVVCPRAGCIRDSGTNKQANRTFVNICQRSPGAELFCISTFAAELSQNPRTISKGLNLIVKYLNFKVSCNALE